MRCSRRWRASPPRSTVRCAGHATRSSASLFAPMTRTVLILALLLGGCAGTPDNPLIWSDEVVRALPLENGEAVEVARFSGLQPGAALAPWEPWFVRRGNAPTEYR